jgi:putative phage-type endonuclease
MISATDVSTILCLNKQKSIQDLLEKKVYNIRSKDTNNTLHGKKFESSAISVLENELETNIKEIGYIISEKIPFLGATPDGITYYNNEIHLIEIKCPTTRKIDGLIPYNYFTQIQLQLYVCNIQKCIYFECEFEEITKQKYKHINDKNIHKGYNKEYNNYWILHDSSLMIIEKDDSFIKKYLKKLDSFNEKLKEMNKKRNCIIEHQTKKRKLNRSIKDEFILSKEFIRSYVVGDKCDAWLSMYGNKYYKEEKVKNEFSNELFKKCKEISKNFIDEIIDRCIDNNLIYEIIPKYFKYNEYLNEKTKRYMNNNIDVIINPMLYDNEKKIYSNPSYIVKCKIFDRLFSNNSNEINFSRRDNNKYCIVNKISKNIKYINEGNDISSDQKHLYYSYINKFDNYILNKEQKYNINKTFLIGNKWSYVKDKKKIMGLSDSKIGNYIHDLVEDKKDIINYQKWIQNIYDNDDKFIIFNDNSFLPVYIKNEMSEWSDFKKNLLEQKNDINLLYGVGRVKKKLFYENNIFSWKDKNLPNLLKDEKELTNFKISKKNSIIMSNIINFNTKSKNLISNITIKDKKFLKEDSIEIYVDFETLNDFLANINMIYLVGMYVKFPNNKFKYFSFFAKKNDLESENKIINEWISKIKEIKKEYNLNYEPKIYCWSKAENNFLNQYNKRHNLNIKINFVDLLEFIKKEIILIKGNIYGFGIKSVVKFMYEHKMINRNYKLDCNSGDLSIISAIKYYRNNDKKEYNDLIKYNYTDCSVMYDILNYFRNYYK